MSSKEQYIGQYFGIQPQLLPQTATFFKENALLKNEYFCRQGRNCNTLSFIRSGALRVFAYQDGKEVTQWIAAEGELITDLSSIMFGTTARWEIQALSDCELYSIERNDLNRLGDFIPNWATLEKTFISKCFLMLEDRVFSFLSMTAEERYQQFLVKRMHLFNEVPHQYIASMLGMTPETLSRLRNKNLK